MVVAVKIVSLKAVCCIRRPGRPNGFVSADWHVFCSCRRCVMYTGHVTSGGSICLESLTLSGTPGSWRPDYTVESLLNVIVLNMIDCPVAHVASAIGLGGVSGPLRVDFNYHNPTLGYSSAEARASFARTLGNHLRLGWGEDPQSSRAAAAAAAAVAGSSRCAAGGGGGSGGMDDAGFGWGDPASRYQWFGAADYANDGWGASRVLEDHYKHMLNMQAAIRASFAAASAGARFNGQYTAHAAAAVAATGQAGEGAHLGEDMVSADGDSEESHTARLAAFRALVSTYNRRQQEEGLQLHPWRAAAALAGRSNNEAFAVVDDDADAGGGGDDDDVVLDDGNGIEDLDDEDDDALGGVMAGLVYEAPQGRSADHKNFLDRVWVYVRGSQFLQGSCHKRQRIHSAKTT